MTLLVPMYVHPAVDPAAWRALVAAAPRLYGVVLNIDDGPGTAPDPAFADAARALRAAGVRVLGYTDTDYGRRPARAVALDFERHRDWYATDGFFLDQVAPDPAGLRHYRRLARAARARGGRTVALNPGVHPAPGYASVADLLVTFEGNWDAYRTAPVAPAWTADHPPETFCHLVHGVPTRLCGLAARTAELRRAAVHCAVAGHGPNPWSALPPALRKAS
ncbi:spherulation-specific family 4 protein [Streptomyces sp. NBC_01142]|uniref:spherulation-specific family 4 protein n=1 Tax=Streptomyces sp. NBC_01142 TaxID=2975865 RepID=UPI0022518D53|nr:spherulation-specific family 4 protein [Streptomyces sp. NBC_01142]MCX4820819.1 spherulation-specific family 4 protein [Streptomyces sp. NBC_01142]